ncbi:MAG TPA: 16S rRNA (adenine(1518)-N(6)/adenine(1519)-N(6))-dimethyltransferase RsmA [Nevskiaceae bacterium]|nr:16S rRNA (adenine(1518)-N(6)/adenine(1519)-N(6))-dimethyltransferase RsmA [Nevskiaceae bacterium]
MSVPHQARKRFGQNFLHDPGVIARIVKAIDPQPGDDLVEIGPGLGALTAPLLARLGRMRVVELDRDVIPHLRAACGDAPGLEVIQADALTVDFGALAGSGKLRVVGNLPYNISTPLLFHLLDYAPQIRDMHFMLQKEVVQRICAGAGEPDYGRLSVSLAARCDAAHLFNVGPGAFRPAPQVDSAIVRLVPRPPPVPIISWRNFDRVVSAAFSQRRKTLTNSLRGLLDAAQIRTAGVDPSLRAERLDVPAYARLAELLPAQPAGVA